MRLPFIVLDQNALTRDEVLQPAIAEARRLNLRLMLTDATLIEIVEAEKWEQRMRLAFARLASARDLVTVAVPIPDLYRIEVSTGRPAFEQLEDVKYRTAVRNLLTESQLGEGETLEFLRARIATTKARVLPQYLDRSANKQMVQDWVSVFRREFSKCERQRLKDPAYRRTALASAIWTDSIRGIVENLKFNGAEKLARGPSVIAHDIFSTALVAAKGIATTALRARMQTKSRMTFSTRPMQ